MKTIEIIKELTEIYDIKNLNKKNILKILNGELKFNKYCHLINLFFDKVGFDYIVSESYDDFKFKLGIYGDVLECNQKGSENTNFIRLVSYIDLSYYNNVFNQILYNEVFFISDDYKYEHEDIIMRIENAILSESMDDYMKGSDVKINKKRL